MTVTKGEKIKSLFHTHGGAKNVEKFSWNCSCGRIYQSRASAQKCDESNHKKVDVGNLLNIREINVSNLTFLEQDVLGYLNCVNVNKFGFDCVYNGKFYDPKKVEHR